jgi:hypothetical protein
MPTIFFDRAIVSPMEALRAPRNAVGLQAQIWHFTKSEVLTRVIAVFSSFVALAEAIAQLLHGNLAAAGRFFFCHSWAMPLAGILSPNLLFRTFVWELQKQIADGLRGIQNLENIQRGPRAPQAQVPQIHLLRNRVDVTAPQLEAHLQANGGLVNAPNQNGRTALSLEIGSDNPREPVITTLLNHGATYQPGVEFSNDTIASIWETIPQRGMVFVPLLRHVRTHEITFDYLRRDLANADRTTLSILLEDCEKRLVPLQVEIMHIFTVVLGVGGGQNNPTLIIAQYTVPGLDWAEERAAQTRLDKLRAEEGMKSKAIAS